MLPFHKIYSFLFKSFNVHSETETVTRMKDEWIQKIMVIKRSWIYGLSLVWIPITIAATAWGNIALSILYHKDPLIFYTNIVGVGLSLILFLISVVLYLYQFRKTYEVPHIAENLSELLADLHYGDQSFIRFFNQTIINQIIILMLIVSNVYFYFWYKNIWSVTVVMVDIILLVFQWVFLKMYRKRMIDLEMDYTIVSPGKVTFINQSGMLSQSQSVDGDKVKTVTSKYPSWIASFFHYGTIEVLTEGDALQGTTIIYFVPSPGETARFMEALIFRKEEEKSTPEPSPEIPFPAQDPTPINQVALTENTTTIPKNVVYDVKWVVRDVLR